MSEALRTPKRLTNDAIVEALLEVRFREPAVPEVFFGRVADHRCWTHWVQRKLPAYQLPVQIRETEVALRYAPIIELLEPQGQGALRIGPRVASLHRAKPYPGWETFRQQISQVIKTLFDTVAPLAIERIGLRYINALRTDLHFIDSPRDLAVTISDGQGSIQDSFNLNFSKDLDSQTKSMVRIATLDFIQGETPPNTAAVVDIDVFSKDFFPQNASDAEVWINKAHGIEKNTFFHLLPLNVIERLKES